MAVHKLKRVSTPQDLPQDDELEFDFGAEPAPSRVTESPENSAKPTESVPLHDGGINIAGSKTLDLQAAERFKFIRAKLERLNLSGHLKQVLAVTSAVPAEGKSLIASNLARALAQDPRGKTLLVDCDLRKPAVHKYCQLASQPGLSDALVGQRALAGVIQKLDPGLDVLTAGSPVVDATRAIELPQMAAAIAQLRKHYRYIVLDCPPVLLCPEPLVLSSLVDGTIMVVRAWVTTKTLVRDALNALGKEKCLGVIVNDAYDAVNEYSNYGYYSYDYKDKVRKQAKI